MKKQMSRSLIRGVAAGATVALLALPTAYAQLPEEEPIPQEEPVLEQEQELAEEPESDEWIPGEEDAVDAELQAELEAEDEAGRELPSTAGPIGLLALLGVGTAAGAGLVRLRRR